MTSLQDMNILTIPTAENYDLNAKNLRHLVQINIPVQNL